LLQLVVVEEEALQQLLVITAVQAVAVVRYLVQVVREPVVKEQTVVQGLHLLVRVVVVVVLLRPVPMDQAPPTVAKAATVYQTLLLVQP
jgi:hypothetical protein